MPHFSFLFDCSTTPATDITESHPFGPTDSGFNTDLGMNITNYQTTNIKAITRGRLFTHGSNLILQPFYIPVNRRDGIDEEESEWALFNTLFGQPFAFCYKNIAISQTLLDEHIRAKAALQNVEAHTIHAQVLTAFRNGTESVFVNAGANIGLASERSIAFEVFYISNGISELMPSGISGLDIIRRLYSNPITRRIDPIYFFSSIPDSERLNFTKNGTNENPIFNQFTRRILLEIRNEYDEFYVGNFDINRQRKDFTNQNHGTVSLNDVPPRGTPQTISYSFHDADNHSVFTQLPSGSDWRRIVSRDNKKAPYHHATQMIYMHDSDDTKNWFHQNTLLRYTENNHVQYLIDGRSTFLKMVEEIEKTNSSDHYIRIAGWIMYRDLQMDLRTTLRSILQRKHDEGVKINILIYNNRMDNQACLDSVNFVNSLRNGWGILDDSLPGIVGSHHQKIMIIKNREGVIGFCGGVDLNPDRLDDSNHTKPTNQGKAFHDIHALVKGPAVIELNKTFVHRWNTHIERFQNYLAINSSIFIIESDKRVRQIGTISTPISINGTDYYYNPGTRLSALEEQHSNNEVNAKAFVQVTRTFSQRYASTLFPFQPNGEVGTLNALKQAISRAKKYIYIEDQYLYPYGGDMPNPIPDRVSDISDSLASSILANDRNGVGILAALYSKLQSNPNLVLIILTSGPDKYDQGPLLPLVHTPITGRSMERMIFFIRMLRHARSSTTGSDKIIFCYPRATTSNQIYVHSKLWIIDDIYVKIGSANCGRRSLTLDTEADIHVIDGSLQNGYRKFARTFRKKLWAEHLGIQNSEYLDDLDYTLTLWQDLANMLGANATPYSNYRIGLHTFFWDQNIDPEGRSHPPTNPPITPPLSTYDQ